MDSKLSGITDMLEEATIQLTEASDELRHYCERLVEPQSPVWPEQRIAKQFRWRENIMSAEALPQLYQSLLEEQQQLDDQAGSLETLTLAI